MLLSILDIKPFENYLICDLTFNKTFIDNIQILFINIIPKKLLMMIIGINFY